MPKLVQLSFIVFIINYSNQDIYAQEYYNENFVKKYWQIETDSGFYIIHFSRGVCKNYSKHAEFFPNWPGAAIAATKETVAVNVKLVTLHGNISYDYYYRRGIDTLFNQQNFQQHTERIYLDVLIKEKFPLKIVLNLRQSNSLYFKNFSDVNFQFNQPGYYKNLKQDIINGLSKSLQKKAGINALTALLREKEKQFTQIKNWLESPATLQKVIEERERKYAGLLRVKYPLDEANTANGDGEDIMKKFTEKQEAVKNRFGNVQTKDDRTMAKFTGVYETKKTQSDSIASQIKVLNRKIDSLEAEDRRTFIAVREKIYKAKNEKDLRKIAAENDIDAGLQNKFQSRVASIKHFSLGRNEINYTELTAKNITLTGLNVEYNSSYYVAFAAGKIDYRFRDFFNKSAKSTGQYLVLGRAGVGDPEKRALIVTIFEGRKNVAQFAMNDTAVNHVNIIGYSIEAILKKDENTGLSIEVAKSTKPVTGNLHDNKQLNALWKFNDQNNAGINLKANAIIPSSNTRLSGFFRKTGEDFQSFSLFSYNTNQIAWVARADQYLFGRKVNITAMLRRNDFTNPFTDKTYKTSTVFKSILVNVRVPKYPSFSLGYFPGNQVYIVNKETIRENAYYIFNGSLVHNYRYKGIAMSSVLMYNRYVNQATDSGFSFYKGYSYYSVQTIFLRRLQLESGYSAVSRPELKYFTIESSGNYSFKNFFRLSMGIKYNKMRKGNNFWGETILLSADFKPLGRLQLQYEKSYLPTITQTLYPVEIGRASWYKYF